MGKNNRWMTWVLEESARTNVTMPWARGNRPDWKQRLAIESPGLAKILQTQGAQNASVNRAVRLPRQAAS